MSDVCDPVPAASTACWKGPGNKGGADTHTHINTQLHPPDLKAKKTENVPIFRPLHRGRKFQQSHHHQLSAERSAGIPVETPRRTVSQSTTAQEIALEHTRGWLLTFLDEKNIVRSVDCHGKTRPCQRSVGGC